MASVVQIANRALTKLGSARITSLDDDVKAARSIKSCFEDLRDDELRANRWSFSIKRTQLAAASSTPLFGFSYQYPLPADFLKVDQVGNYYPSPAMDNYISAEDPEWAIEAGYILSNASAPLNFRYVAQVTDPNLWDPNFREMLAARIAMEICEDLTQSDTKFQKAAMDYKRAVAIARHSGAIERLPNIMADDAWVISRI